MRVRRRKKKEREREGDKGRDPIAKEKGPNARWKGLVAKREKREMVAARCRGCERKTARGKP